MEGMGKGLNSVRFAFMILFILFFTFYLFIIWVCTRVHVSQDVLGGQTAVSSYHVDSRDWSCQSWQQASSPIEPSHQVLSPFPYFSFPKLAWKYVSSFCFFFLIFLYIFLKHDFIAQASHVCTAGLPSQTLVC